MAVSNTGEITRLKCFFNKKPLEGVLSDFAEPVLLHKVDETINESFWNKLVNDHHYLGYENTIGCRVKYLISLGERLVGAISYVSGAYKLGLRDKFVGWDEQERLGMLSHLVCNNRFLIFPWVKIQNLASHVLSLSLKQLRIDWKNQYGVEPYMAETFVDSEKFRGTCYVADNWIRLGETMGFGKIGKGFVFHGKAKDIYVKVINHQFAKNYQPNVDRLPDRIKEIQALIEGGPLNYSGILENLGIVSSDIDALPATLAAHLALYLWRYKDGKKKYALCNESPLATLEDIRIPALARCSINQCFMARDDNLGIGNCEFRTWHGWRRHFLLTLIAHLFILKLSRQQISNATDVTSRLRRN